MHRTTPACRPQRCATPGGYVGAPRVSGVSRVGHRVRRGPGHRSTVSQVTQEETRAIDPCPPDQATIDRLLGGAHHDPHSVLGAHPHADGTVIRVAPPARRRGARGAATAARDLSRWSRCTTPGCSPGVVPGPAARLPAAVRYGERVDIVDDPYRWLPTLGEVDLHLIGEGRHERLWDVLGAHVRRYDTPSGPVTGTSFAVWAPTRAGRAGHRRLRRLDRLGAPDALAGQHRRVGAVRARTSAPAPATSSASSATTAAGGRRPTRWPSRTEIPPATASVVDESDATSGATTTWLTAARRSASRTPSR